MESSKMDIELNQESSTRMETPRSSSPPKIGGDSGYLSHSQCSPFNETHSKSSSVLFSGFSHPSSKFHSLHDEGIYEQSSSMEFSDSLENDFSEPKSKVRLVPVDLPKVHQSTPATKRPHVNLLKEFEFVTPLPGPSHHTSRNSSSLAGQTHADILSLLSQKGMQPPLQQILNYLEPEDLCQVRLVSSSWRNLLRRCPQFKVWKTYVKLKQQNQENMVTKSEEVLVTPASTRGLLRDIDYNVRVVPSQASHSPPVSPSKRQHILYYREGQKLESGEQLRKCPRCSGPARVGVDSCNSGARCTRQWCRYHFCMDCSGPFHDTPCAKIGPVTPTKAKNRAHRARRKKLHRLLF